MRFLQSAFRVLITLVAVGVAGVLVVMLWQSYMLSPWTRDGRVQVQVVNVASEVAGTVVDVPVRDNQFVHKNDVLFQVDPTRFHLAVAQAQAALESAQNQLSFAQSESRRQQRLTVYASEEAREKAENTMRVAQASLDQAQVALDVAKLNLARSTVISPVNGYVTHLRLRAGAYVNAGVAQLAVVDSDSFWIEGYFEETKLARIRVGDKAQIRLMGEPVRLTGHVESIAAGIEDRDRGQGANLLANVNPTFSWVRLAQRVPVRIALDHLPDRIALVAGRSATVEITD